MKKEQEQVAIHWFRRDLRLHDNAALDHALRSGFPVQCVFIFDTEILSALRGDEPDHRVQFIHHHLLGITAELNALGASLRVYHDSPHHAWKQIVREFNVGAVFTNQDYEPYARKRDEEVSAFLREHKIGFHSFKDQVIFEKSEVVKDDGTPYTVFTPYKNKFRQKLNEFYLSSYPNKKYFDCFVKAEQRILPSITDLGFKTDAFLPMKPVLEEAMLTGYAASRDFPGLDATSRLSVHLRFGTVSVRRLFRYARRFSETWTNELIWREFYMQILWHFPHVAQSAFKPQYNRIPWRNDEREFAAWCAGKTGYPLVDAGMRELNATGFMHNRVRMVVASFLVKHLLIDWRWGEAYFAEKLLDFDLSANNGGWQWAAGSGTDAAPYFRIFNPHEQLRKFDPELKYVKKWIPEFGSADYPEPVVEHKFARERCLQTYKRALNP